MAVKAQTNPKKGLRSGKNKAIGLSPNGLESNQIWPRQGPKEGKYP